MSICLTIINKAKWMLLFCSLIAIIGCKVTFNKEDETLKLFTKGTATFFYDYEHFWDARGHEIWCGNDKRAYSGTGLLCFQDHIEYGPSYNYRTDTLLNDPFKFIYISLKYKHIVKGAFTSIFCTVKNTKDSVIYYGESDIPTLNGLHLGWQTFHASYGMQELNPKDTYIISICFHNKNKHKILLDDLYIQIGEDRKLDLPSSFNQLSQGYFVEEIFRPLPWSEERKKMYHTLQNVSHRQPDLFKQIDNYTVISNTYSDSIQSIDGYFIPNQSPNQTLITSSKQDSIYISVKDKETNKTIFTNSIPRDVNNNTDFYSQTIIYKSALKSEGINSVTTDGFYVIEKGWRLNMKEYRFTAKSLYQSKRMVIVTKEEHPNPLYYENKDVIPVIDKKTGESGIMIWFFNNRPIKNLPDGFGIYHLETTNNNR